MTTLKPYLVSATLYPNTVNIECTVMAESAAAAGQAVIDGTAPAQPGITRALLSQAETLGYTAEDLAVEELPQSPQLQEQDHLIRLPLPGGGFLDTQALVDAARCALADLQGLSEHAAFDDHPLHETVRELQLALHPLGEPLPEPTYSYRRTITVTQSAALTVTTTSEEPLSEQDVQQRIHAAWKAGHYRTQAKAALDGLSITDITGAEQ